MRQSACTALSVAITLTAWAAQAAPYCAAFSDPEALPKKYTRLAPVLSDTDTGWIFTQDQLDLDYTLKPRPKALLKEIADAFDRLGIRLVILMPPPRPIFAGQAAFDATNPLQEKYNTTDVSARFTAMTAEVRALGIVMPDLSRLAEDPDLQAQYYFKRDTHWTPFGAALSAHALSQTVRPEHIPPAPVASDLHHEEPGSLSKMARKVCGIHAAPEIAPYAMLPQTENNLLSDSSTRPKIALAGSSFSDRYKRDALRVADALSAYLQADIANYSVSGGGPIGAIEGLISSGQLENEPFDMVVWELPYTEGLNNESALRQLLGALLIRDSETRRTAILESGSPVMRPPGTALPDVLLLGEVAQTTERHTIEVRYRNRKPSIIKLVRKSRIPLDLRDGPWAVGLAALPPGDIESFTLQ